MLRILINEVDCIKNLLFFDVAASFKVVKHSC